MAVNTIMIDDKMFLEALTEEIGDLLGDQKQTMKVIEIVKDSLGLE